MKLIRLSLHKSSRGAVAQSAAAVCCLLGSGLKQCRFQENQKIQHTSISFNVFYFSINCVLQNLIQCYYLVKRDYDFVRFGRPDLKKKASYDYIRFGKRRSDVMTT
ncbi:unnamed protein product [Angiostrongylus costaricensis]|uniref:Secreted protein n=1 Tax=Angiostrongylus costaricensis TaxID=334426 RepID=A0A0R3PDB0_ANGCS|nr:unnamed protein product [Angiostrongylus costaricensis]